MLNKLSLECNILQNKVRFIRAIIDNSLDIKNKPIDVVSNLHLYDFIVDKMGYTNETNINKKNKLFYGNLNKRLNKQIKYKTLK